MRPQELDLLNDRVPSLFRHFAIPGVISSLSMCLYGIIDGIILGQFIGPNAMAAVNMASPIFNIVSCLAILIAIGGNTLVGISLGGQDREKANHYFNNAVTALFVIAAVIWAAVAFFPGQLARAVGANAALLPFVKQYIQTFGFFVIPIIFNIILGISLQSVGKPQLYMVGNMLTMGINIALDLLFICVFKWGIFGAALASGISATIVFLLFLSKFVRKDSILKIGRCRLDVPALLQMAYNGSSEAITQLCGGLANLIFNWLLISRFGEVGVSAFAAVQYISLAVNAIIMGMSRGVAPIISVNFGGRALQRVRGILSIAVKTVTVTGILCTAILLVFKNPLIAAFVKNDSGVFETAKEIITYYSMNFIFVGANVVINTFYTAINDPKTSAGLAVIRFALLLCAFFALPPLIGNIGLWLSFAAAEFVCLLVSMVTLKISGRRWSPEPEQ